ncbi:MAG: bZIP transcription factor [Cyanobacteria bacterium REEB67]|nr:bZIP transcription factor [Cyanobacteria bacterium REEB67]
MQASESDKNFRRATALLLCACFLLLFFGRAFYWFYHPLLVWCDQSVYLEIAELIMQGKVPYRDAFDFNPPLIMYLNVVPVVVAKVLHLSSALCFALTVLALNAFSSGFALWLAYKNRALPGSQFVIIATMIFFFALYTVGLDTDMGQREHLFMLFYLPFFIVRGIVWQGGAVGRREALLAGVFAGIGLALKPQFILCAVLAELGFLLSAKKVLRKLYWRPENIAVLAVFVAYGLCFLLLPSAARHIFFDQAIPVYVVGGQWSAKCLIHMIASTAYGVQPFINLITALLLAFLLRGKSCWLLPLVLFSLGAFFNYFQGGQSWTYRLLPMAFAAFMIYGVCLGIALQALFSRFASFVPGRLILAALLFFALLCGNVMGDRAVIAESRDNDCFDLSRLGLGYSGTCPRSYLSPMFFCLVQNSRAGDYVLHLGTPVAPGFPAILQSGRRSASRYLYCFLIWLEYAREKSGSDTAFFGRLEETVIENYGRDILTNKPVLIMVQDSPIEAILSRYDFYERFMGGYTLIGKVEGHSIYKRSNGHQPGIPGAVAALAEMPRRRAAVLAILSGGKKIKEVALQNDWSEEQVAGWVRDARRALLEVVRDPLADKKEELYQENSRLSEQVEQLTGQVGDLRLQVENLRNDLKKGEKSADPTKNHL